MKFVYLLLMCLLLFGSGYSDRVLIHTGNQWDRAYNFFPLRTNVLQFSIKADHDIHVLLSNAPQHSPPNYEIVIGGWENTKSVIRKDNFDIRVEYESKILNPGSFQSFAVTVNEKDGIIEVGKKAGEPFMFFKDPDFVKMSYFAISTGFYAKGEWNFEFESFYCACNNCNHTISPYGQLKKIT